MTKIINENLRWVRVFSPDVIPKYLIDQIKHKDFTTEDFYKNQKANCLVDTDKGPTLNPFNHLYALADKENIVKGFLWFVIDPMSLNLLINNYSVDKDYWNTGHAVKFLTEHIKEIQKRLKLKKVYWCTRYPKHSERYGFKRSKDILMEYVGEEDERKQNMDGLDRRQEEHRQSKPGSETSV